MIYDFSKRCKTYDADSYKRADFSETRCPKCHAVGRFKLHGSYHRHVLYFVKLLLTYEFIKIKRIKCLSCKTTHAVMPGDIIPYKLLSLFVVLFILNLFYVDRTPVLKIAAAWDFSFQFIYSALSAFRKFAPSIYLYFREVSRGLIRSGLGLAGIFSLIQKPFLGFQASYLESNKRPCFMCKFFNNANAPPIGRLVPVLPPGGQSHNPCIDFWTIHS